MEAGQSYATVSLDTPMLSREDSTSGVTVAETLITGVTEEANRGLDPLVETENIKRALEMLPKRERQIIHMRFFQNLQQMDIAKKLGISQVHVSRIMIAGLAKVKRMLNREAKEDHVEGY